MPCGSHRVMGRTQSTTTQHIRPAPCAVRDGTAAVKDGNTREHRVATEPSAASATTSAFKSGQILLALRHHHCRHHQRHHHHRHIPSNTGRLAPPMWDVPGRNVSRTLTPHSFMMEEVTWLFRHSLARAIAVASRTQSRRRFAETAKWCS